MIRRIFIWVKISIFVLATTLLALITPASSSAAVQRLQDIPTSIITSTVSGPVQTFDSDDSSSPLGSEITSTGASQYQALLTSILPAMSTPLSAAIAN